MADQQQQYKGQFVKDVRPATKNDPGYDKEIDQVVVTLADGNVKTVRRTEVTKA
jgi:mRNA-degrading endonuclease YafQ of YafQ-DinJ toxin-antitoxin module